MDTSFNAIILLHDLSHRCDVFFGGITGTLASLAESTIPLDARSNPENYPECFRIVYSDAAIAAQVELDSLDYKNFRIWSNI